MSESTRLKAIVSTLAGLTLQLDALEACGRGIPAVEKNVVRLRGTLHALAVQFRDLSPAGTEGSPIPAQGAEGPPTEPSVPLSVTPG